MTKSSQTADTTKGESAKARPKLLMVLGMHRSGTSAITKGLEVLGVDLGENLIPPQDDNPKGFFEDRELIELNERVLKKTGHSWYDLAPIDPALMTGPDLLTERLEAGAFIRRKLNASEAVGLKDPRLSILMPFWFDVLQDIDVETGYIIPVRNPLAVAHSVMVRNRISLDRAATLWGRYIYDALRATGGANRIFIDFDRLLEAPVPEIERLAATFGFEMPAANSKALKSYTDDFLESMLRNQSVSRKELKRTGHTAGVIIDLYNKLGELAELPAGDPSVSSNRALSTLLKRIEGVTPLICAIDRADHSLKQIETRLHEVQTAHDSALDQRDAARARADEALEQLAVVRQGAEEALKARDEFSAAHDSALAQRDEAQARVEEALEQLAVVRQGAEEALKARDEFSNAHDSALAQRDEAQARVEEALEQLAVVRKGAEESLKARDEFSAAHDSALEQRDAAMARVEALAAASDFLRKANEEALAARDSWQSSYEEAIAARDAVQSAHDLACQQRDSLSLEVAQLTSERDSLTRDHSAAMETLASERRAHEAKARALLAIARQELETSDHLRQALAASQAIIEQYRSSTSWKLTAPLRGLIRFATGAAQADGGKTVRPPAHRGMSPFLLKLLDGKKMRSAKRPPPALAAEHKASGGPQLASGHALVGVVIHAYYPELLPEILEMLGASRVSLKLYVTTEPGKAGTVHELLERSPFSYELIQCENRGRDIGPFLSAMKWVNHDRPDYVLKLHTKRSTHLRNGEAWRAHLYESLLGMDGPARAVERFELSPQTGLLGPDGHILSTQDFAGTNAVMMADLAQRFAIAPSDLTQSGFVAGSMFYVRRELVADVTDETIPLSGFDLEQGQIDGTLAHAMERVFGALVMARGYKVASLGNFIQQPEPLRRGAYQYV